MGELDSMDVDHILNLMQHDADARDFTFQHMKRDPKQLFVDMQDEQGALHYHVPDTDKFVEQVKEEIRTEGTEVVDAIWFILQEHYVLGK